MTFYPAHLPLPELLQTPHFILEPLRPSHNALDYEAVMSSRAQLRLWGGHDWPADDFSAAANHEDLALHWREHQGRIAFTYTVLQPDRARCLGCVYIRPLAELQAGNPDALPDLSPGVALARFWVRSDQLNHGLEARLLTALRDWFAGGWPLQRLLFETRQANTRQVARFLDAGLHPVLALEIPDRGGTHLFFELPPPTRRRPMSPTIERYVNIRAAYGPTFSADGRFLAFLSDISGLLQVWQVELETGDETIPWPDQLTFAPDRVLYARYSPLPGDNRLFYAHDIGGDENAQLFLLDTAAGTETHLSAGHESAMHLPGAWAADGQSVLFAANRRHPGQFDLYRQPLDGRPAELLWQHEAPGYLAEQIWSPDGRRVAVVRVAHTAAHDLLELDLAGGSVRRLSPPDQPARYAQISYSTDGRFLYAVTDRAADFLHVARLELATRAWETLVSPNADIELLAQSPNGRYLAFTTNRDGDSRLELIDLATGLARPAPEPATRPGVIGWYDGHLDFSADSRRLAFSYTSATRTSDVYIWNVDLGDDDMRRKTDSSHGGLPLASFVTPRSVRYPSFDGRDIPAFFYEPPAAAGSAPVILLVHGGPESQFRPYFHFLVQYFVHNGYAVFAPNVRGSTGYGNAYAHLDDVERRLDSVADLAAAARWLREQPGVDGDKLVVYGGSYGGFMVLSALTNYPDLWAAGVNIVGISNFVTFLENTSAYRRAHRESEYGSLAENREFLHEISPLNHVDQIAVPLLVIHGANDPRVPLSEAQQIVDALAARGVPAPFLVFDDEGHGVVKLKNKLELYPTVLDFLAGVLGDPSSGGAKEK